MQLAAATAIHVGAGTGTGGCTTALLLQPQGYQARGAFEQGTALRADWKAARRRRPSVVLAYGSWGDITGRATAACNIMYLKTPSLANI